jgi:hypothetical protein
MATTSSPGSGERILDLEDTDLPYGVAADAAGNVIVVGATFDATGTPSIVVRKYEP